MSQFINDFQIPVLPHDRCAADQLRIILDRPFVIFRDDGSASLGFSMIVEAYGEGYKFAEKRYQSDVSPEGLANPLWVIEAIALALFPDSHGNPLMRTNQATTLE